MATKAKRRRLRLRDNMQIPSRHMELLRGRRPTAEEMQRTLERLKALDIARGEVAKEATAQAAWDRERILTQHEVSEVTSLHRSTVWRLERAGQFPKHVQVSRNRVGWRASEVRAWITTRRPRSEA